MAIHEVEPGYVVSGRYQLISEIGHGGMGRVWEARDTQLDRLVAVKEVLLPALPPAQQEIRLKQAEREGKNAAALADHAHIVTVYDVVVDGGSPWIVMQLVRGRSLRNVLRDPANVGVPDDQDVQLTPLSRRQVGQIAEAMFSALDTMHKAGIVHRDIKPHNILMADDGGILLTDFGIAKSESDATVTVSGSVMGTMAYIAPERAEGETGSPASDFFSLGVTLFEAVEGHSPFERKNSKTGTLTAILTKPLPPMKKAGKLAPLIEALTMKVPDQRPDHAQALALLSGEGTGGWTRPSVDEAVTETAPSGLGMGKAGSPSKKAKMPWESVTLTGSAGLPRPPVIDTPQPKAKSAAPTTSGVPDWLGTMVVGGLIVAGIIGYNVYKHNHDHRTSPSALSTQPSYSAPVFPVASTTFQPAVTTSSSHEDMTTGCSDASDAIKKFNSASGDAGPANTTSYWSAMATAFGDEGQSLNDAAGSADDDGVRTALQNEATLDVQIHDVYNTLANTQVDTSNNSELDDQISELDKLQNLLDQNETADQGRIHACQNAAHE